MTLRGMGVLLQLMIRVLFGLTVVPGVAAVAGSSLGHSCWRPCCRIAVERWGVMVEELGAPEGRLPVAGGRGEGQRDG